MIKNFYIDLHNKPISLASCRRAIPKYDKRMMYFNVESRIIKIFFEPFRNEPFSPSTHIFAMWRMTIYTKENQDD